jgi:tRNA dimethylallyltransferase
LSAKSEDAELPRAIVIVGPTASGKSDLALRWATRFDGEIVNADSVQIYRHFDIGSGKPSAEELARVPHHLLGTFDPHAEMDASIFAELAIERIREIEARGKIAIVCGGTFLWVRALLFGLVPAPPKDESLRERHRQFVAERGREALHEQLSGVDPASYARLMPNDFVRVSRALEVFELTGKPLSELQQAHGFATPRLNARLFGVAQAREELHRRIAERTLGMFAKGWLDEVRDLIAQGFGDTRPMASVGYREVHQALTSGEQVEISALAEQVSRATRVFARRQLTWLREQPVHWLSPEQCNTETGWTKDGPSAT